MMSRIRLALTGLGAIFALLLNSAAGAVPAGAAPAATVIYNVNSTNDVVANFSNDADFTVCHTNPTNSVCTLRAAIMNANRHLSGPAIINLPAGTYLLTIPKSANPFDDSAGSLDISHTVTLVGAGAASTIIDGGGLDSVFLIAVTGVFTLTGVTIQHGHSGGGGAIANNGQLSLADSVLRNNTGLEGGALESSGTVTVSRSAFLSNISGKFGGAINSSGNFTLNASTVSGNTALDGGAIENGGTLIVFDSTLSNNSAENSGGAIENSGAARLYHTTIAGNLADDDGNGNGIGGGIFTGLIATNMQLFNTLLASNFVSHTANECVGTIDSQDYNLIQPSVINCTLTGITTHNVPNPVFPLLGKLADNGGSTQTRALLAGSPALDQIPASLNGPCRDPFGAAPVPDQRGVARPINGLCDIGAYEGAQPEVLFSRNLVRNGDAEASAGAINGAWVGAPEWSVFPGQFTVVQYNATGGFPSVPTDTVPANHGANFLAGGSAPESDGVAIIAIHPIAGLIDTGDVSFVLAADLGGFLNQDDHAQVIVTFGDLNRDPVGVGRAIGPVSAADRGNQTKFLHRFATGRVPIGARFIFVAVHMTLAAGCPGCYNDGYADNVSLVLTPPPLYLPFVVK